MNDLYLLSDAEILAELIQRNEQRQQEAIAATGRGNFHTHHLLHGVRNALWAAERRDAEEKRATVSVIDAACRERHGSEYWDTCVDMAKHDDFSAGLLQHKRECMARALALGLKPTDDFPEAVMGAGTTSSVVP